MASESNIIFLNNLYFLNKTKIDFSNKKLFIKSKVLKIK